MSLSTANVSCIDSALMFEQDLLKHKPHFNINDKNQALQTKQTILFSSSREISAQM